MDNCYLDALAVITFFKMSHKKHLFITGDRGSGKSYLLNNILNQIEETMDMSDFFNYLLSRRTDTPEVVIKSNLIDDGKEYVIGRPRTLTPVSVSYTHLDVYKRQLIYSRFNGKKPLCGTIPSVRSC